MVMVSVVKDDDLKYIPNLDRLIREPTCREMTTLSNSTRWRMEREGRFPPRRKIGPTAVAYRVSEIQAWIRGEWHPGWKPDQSKL
ncbi:AlpA family phage regulatory protein [Edwardsiella piscicida]|uniref:helix-turn-helix transcriptional regulator n=1 Tax=Edwardsiella piscicida TaxID=1263550 RepID=UPI000D50B756|nr:AlpA family phage regulatory protein [Edwardsiella piscicida]UCQ40468.1 AlpA family phage regulatory protein [Edwardsiella piscicida]